MDELVCMEHSYIVVEDGRVAGVFRTLPERYAQLPVLDYGEQLILPGMTDLHIHAPQFAFRGLGMDMELLEWLNTYTFPEESKYKELEYADRAYGSFVNHLLHSTTTRAAIFATIHVPATELLMQKLDEAGYLVKNGEGWQVQMRLHDGLRKRFYAIHSSIRFDGDIEADLDATY